MICDVHAHYLPRSFSDFMSDRFWPPVGKPTRTSLACHPFSDLPEDISGRFDLMSAAGVEKQVLSPHWPPYLPNEAEGVQAIKLLNDGYADLAQVREIGRVPCGQQRVRDGAEMGHELFGLQQMTLRVLHADRGVDGTRQPEVGHVADDDVLGT